MKGLRAQAKKDVMEGWPGNVMLVSREMRHKSVRRRKKRGQRTGVQMKWKNRGR